jgi:hypothetical protein
VLQAARGGWKKNKERWPRMNLSWPAATLENENGGEVCGFERK